MTKAIYLLALFFSVGAYAASPCSVLESNLPGDYLATLTWADGQSNSEAIMFERQADGSLVMVQFSNGAQARDAVKMSEADFHGQSSCRLQAGALELTAT